MLNSRTDSVVNGFLSIEFYLLWLMLCATHCSNYFTSAFIFCLCLSRSLCFLISFILPCRSALEIINSFGALYGLKMVFFFLFSPLELISRAHLIALVITISFSYAYFHFRLVRSFAFHAHTYTQTRTLFLSSAMTTAKDKCSAVSINWILW